MLAVAVAVLTFAGCGDGDGGDPAAGTTTVPTTASTSTSTSVPDAWPRATCSASRLSEDVPEAPGIPAPVAMMRKEILKAAVRCDFELLEQLALRGDGTFQYSFGQSAPTGSAEFWKEREAEGEGVLAAMVKVLSLPHATQGVREPEGPGTGSATTSFTWP